MSGDNHDIFRFSSGPVVKVAAAIIVALILGLVVTVIVTGGNGIAVGMLVAVAIAGGTGLVLERIDSTRNRRQGTERTHDEQWGYHGRPGR